MLKEAAEIKELSARGWFGALKVARTIADLDGADQNDTPHMAEALSLRVLQL